MQISILRRACFKAQTFGQRRLLSTGVSNHRELFEKYRPKEPSSTTLKDISNAGPLYCNLVSQTQGDASKNQVTQMTPKMEVFIRELQKSICANLEEIEMQNKMPKCAPTHGMTGQKFIFDEHIRDPASGMAGGSVAAVLQNGAVFEKAGVNISVICGNMPASRLSNMRANHSDLAEKLAKQNIDTNSNETFPFSVAGLSLVLHPHNPHVPTVHANYRMFEMNVGTERVSWFGGGSDLTPTYVVPSDAQYFHEVIRSVCDANDKNITDDPKSQRILYPKYKKWCDEYFYIPHRGETRGVGGLFFDDLDSSNSGLSHDDLFKFVTDCGDHFSASYFPLVVSNVEKPYTEEEKRFQQLRRGRYVEFNLMYDRGTKFGLEMPSSANVRTEAILMSLPLTARYEYRHEPAVGTPEYDTLSILKNPREWL